VLWSVNNWQHFTWRAMYLLVRLSVSRKWPSLKLHPSCPTYIPYMQYILVMFEQLFSTLDQDNNVSSGCVWASSGGIFLKTCVLEPKNIQNNRNREWWDWCVIILMLYNLAIICLVSFYVVFSIFLILQFNRRSTIHFKLLERFVCCLLNSLEHIVVSQCAACGLVLCVCVCQHHVVVSTGN